jgi:hypothetical protein
MFALIIYLVIFGLLFFWIGCSIQREFSQMDKGAAGLVDKFYAWKARRRD